MRRLFASRSWCTICARSANISPPRTSTTAAMRGSFPSMRPASSSSGRSICGGRLSTTYQPWSSSASAAVERPAPDMPVTIKTSPCVWFVPLTVATLSRRSPACEVRVDCLGELRADAGELLDLFRCRLAERGDGSEVLEERFDARLPQPGNLGEHRADVALASRALMGDREAVGLVT